SDVIVVLNNFSTERERSKAQRMADKLLSQGLASQILNVREYLSDSVLSELGLNPRQYWQNNPYFSSAQFAALHWSMPRCDYLLHMTGDTWLHQPVDWIPTAINAMNEVPSMAGFNLCCGEGYARIYTRRAKEQTVRFWISRERRRFPGED